MAMGPIPWTAMVEWCRWHELDPESSRVLIHVIRKLDVDRAHAEQAQRALEKTRGPQAGRR